MLELYLIRHGQTAWNQERRVMGKQPIGLNETGKLQVQQLANSLRDLEIDELYVSPLQRTLETADILLQTRNITARINDSLREIEYGVWVGKTFDELRNVDHYVDPYANPDQPVCELGESLFQVRDRAVEFIENLRHQKDKGRLMLVSHADWIKTVVLHYLELPLTQIRKLRIDNASMTYLTFEGSSCRLVTLNQNFSFDRLFINRPSF